ncbi:hypothetical protein [Thiohalobacter sp.]|uniref:hypothetical protein n=1 Tax=Thiohalobacter sp. TaxID=2025948 RepID=UPI002634259B|nr:hypothetical protein [Thiohalobacter sp.]
MVNKPDIRTAVPKHRYQLGEFQVVVLGEVESGDAQDYRYIMAVVREGDPEPGVYLTCERLPAEQRSGGAYGMRLVMRDGAELLGQEDGWRDLHRFTEDGLAVLRKLLNLGDETPYRLM